MSIAGSISMARVLRALLAIAALTVPFCGAEASVISTATTSCFDETTGSYIAPINSCQYQLQAAATVSGLGTTNLLVTLNTGAGGEGFPMGGDDLLLSARADATVVAYTPGPLRAGFLSVSYTTDHENAGAGSYGGSIAIDGLSGGPVGINVPYEIGTPFTLRVSAYADATCLATRGICGVGAFFSGTDIFAHYAVPGDPDQQFVIVPILDYQPTPTPEARSSELLVLSFLTFVGIKTVRTLRSGVAASPAPFS
jgi:hypothetical protein